MGRLRIRSSALLCGALLATPWWSVAAQPAAQRRTLESFADSLAAVQDTSGLLAAERRLIAQARRDRNNTSLHLTLGFIALRLGELTGGSHFDDAASEFKWATELAPGWPLAWFGLGLAEAAVGENAANTRDERRAFLDKDATSRGRTALYRALALDVDFADELERLALEAQRRGNRARTLFVRETLRRAGTGTRAGRPPALSLVLGRLERALGDTTAALLAFEAAKAAPSRRALATLEIARTRLTAGRPDGIEPYFQAAADDDSATVAELRADLAWIARPEELAAFDSLHGQARAQDLWEFWAGRDRTELRQTGERLREHYRRLELARQGFVDPKTGAVDDRGRVLIRQGEPDDRITHSAPRLAPNESWRYRRSSGDLLLHFAARDPDAGYRLIDGLYDLVPPETVAASAVDNGGQVEERAEVEQMLRSREALSPMYGSDARERSEWDRLRNREHGVVAASVRTALSTDRFPLKFAHALEAGVRFAAVGADDKGTPLQLIIAARLASEDSTTVRARLLMWDTAGRTVASLDSIIPMRRDSSQAEWLVGRGQLPVAPGHYRIKLALEGSAGAGLVTGLDTITVGAVSDRQRLALSDLVLAGGEVALPWRLPGGDQLSVNPLGRYRRGQMLTIYMETSDAAPSSRGRFRVFHRPRGHNDRWKPLPAMKDWSKVVFAPTSVAGVSRIRADVSLDRLRAGAYELEVVVDGARGRTARRRATIEVVDGTVQK